MENLKAQSTTNYEVFDEMAHEVLLQTTNLQEAKVKAWNHQCILKNADTNQVLKDYSCDY